MLFSIAWELLKRLPYPTGHFQIQKLVYITFGFYAGKCQRYLFENRIQAWKCGPVIPALYHELKALEDKCFTLAAVKSHKIIHAQRIDDENVLQTIHTVNRIYAKRDARSLIEYTCADNTPWSQVYDGQESRQIPKELIKGYYKRVLHAKALLDSYKPAFEALSKT